MSTNLSPRETQVAVRMAQGVKPAQIAAELILSPKTVSTYRARVFEKTGCRTNLDLIKWCLENELIPPFNTPDYRGILKKAYRAIKAFRTNLAEDSEATLKLAAVEYEAMIALYGDASETEIHSDG